VRHVLERVYQNCNVAATPLGLLECVDRERAHTRRNALDEGGTEIHHLSFYERIFVIKNQVLGLSCYVGHIVLRK